MNLRGIMLLTALISVSNLAHANGRGHAKNCGHRKHRRFSARSPAGTIKMVDVVTGKSPGTPEPAPGAVRET